MGDPELLVADREGRRGGELEAHRLTRPPVAARQRREFLLTRACGQGRSRSSPGGPAAARPATPPRAPARVTRAAKSTVNPARSRACGAGDGPARRGRRGPEEMEREAAHDPGEQLDRDQRLHDSAALKDGPMSQGFTRDQDRNTRAPIRGSFGPISTSGCPSSPTGCRGRYGCGSPGTLTRDRAAYGSSLSHPAAHGRPASSRSPRWDRPEHTSGSLLSAMEAQDPGAGRHQCEGSSADRGVRDRHFLARNIL